MALVLALRCRDHERMRLRRIAFQLGAGLLVLAALVHIVTLWPRVAVLARLLPTGVWLFFVGYALSVFTALLACGLAVFLLIKASDRADARLLALFLAFLAIYWGSLFRFMNIEATENTVNVAFRYGDNWISQSAVAAFLLAVGAFVRFSTLFPRPLTQDCLPPARRVRRLRALRAAFLKPAVVWGTAIAVILVFRFGTDLVAPLFDLPTDPSARLPRGFFAILVGTGLLCVAWVIAGLAMGTVNLRTSYRIATPEERKRVLWVISGFTVASFMLLGAGGLVLLVAMTDIGAPVFGVVGPMIVLAPLVVVTCAAIGVLYAGAIDPALVLRRSTVWGAVGALGVVLFTAAENGLSVLIEQRLALPGFVAAMAAGILVTALLIPVRARVQRWVNARMLPGTEPLKASSPDPSMPVTQ